MVNSNNILAAFALIRAGLWEKEVQLSMFRDIDFSAIYSFAEKQSVIGLVTAGIEHVTDVKAPQKDVLTFVGTALQLEQRNKAMNTFIADIVAKMREAGIYCILVKGQGLAQCYTRPLWRSAGDIDFFLSQDNFRKTIALLTPLSSENNQDSRYTKSYGLIINGWFVELHGTQRSGLSTRLDNEIDVVQREVFTGGDARSWQNGQTQVFLPGIDSDLFFLFTHFVRHFYHHEFNVRQTCDWCRFLWTYKDRIDLDLLKIRLKRVHLMNEWKSFAAFVVNYLGMPVEAIPFYDSSEKWNNKAKKILKFTLDYRSPSRIRDTAIVSNIFLSNTVRFLPSLLFNLNGKKIKERLFSVSK